MELVDYRVLLQLDSLPNVMALIDTIIDVF